MLDDEMAVEQDAFDFGESGVIAVEICPARLHHGQIGIAEIRQGEAQKIGTGLEIGIEDGDELPSRRLEPLGQRSRFVSFAIRAVQIMNLETKRAVAFDASARDCLSLIGGIVEQLDFEQAGRIVQPRNGLDEALHDVTFVKDRKLYSYVRPGGRLCGFGGDIGAMLGITVDQPITMYAVGREHSQNKEVRDHYGQVEAVELINSAEWIPSWDP